MQIIILFKLLKIRRVAPLQIFHLERARHFILPGQGELEFAIVAAVGLLLELSEVNT